MCTWLTGVTRTPPPRHKCTSAWRASAILSCLFSEVRLLFSRQTQINNRKKDVLPLPSIIMGPPRCRSRRLLPERTEDFGRFVSLSWHGIRACDDCGKARKQPETIKLNREKTDRAGAGFALRLVYWEVGFLVRIVLQHLLGLAENSRKWEETIVS